MNQKMIIEGCRVIKENPFRGDIYTVFNVYTDENDSEVKCVRDIGWGETRAFEVKKKDGTRFFVYLPRYAYCNLSRILNMLYNGQDKRFGNAFDKAFRHLKYVGGYFPDDEDNDNSV